LTRTPVGRVWRRLQRAVGVDTSSPPPVQPDWALLLAEERDRWQAALAAASEGPGVLMATSVGGHQPGVIIETMMAVALTLRGARVRALLCDGLLPACLQAQIAAFPDPAVFAREGPQKQLCRACRRSGRGPYDQLGIPVLDYGPLVSDRERRWAAVEARTVPLEAIPGYEWEGMAVGEHSLAGALRFYARGTLAGEPEGEAVLRRFFQAGLLTSLAMRALLRTERVDHALFHHGIYVPQGLVAESLRRHGVPLSTWTIAYRKSSFIFSHDDTYHHTLLSEPTSSWEDLSLTEAQEAELLDYLKSRWQGTRDWIWFHEKPEEELAAIAGEIGVDFSKPCIGLLTNVMWDAQLHYRANAFPNMLEWVLATIRYFAGRPDLQLLIRVHPAEIRGTLPSRQPLVEEIRAAIPDLPPNVFIIPPESQVSTYAAMLECDSVIIYGTKTGVELTSLGIPVIVAGEAWIRNKGLTLDASSPGEYAAILDSLPLGRRMDPEQVARARRYAYHFFFRRMMPLPFVRPSSGWPPYGLDIRSLDDLMPGASPALDVACDGVLSGAPFIYPAEVLGSPV
jgi:hypothetical protein